MRLTYYELQELGGEIPDADVRLPEKRRFTIRLEDKLQILCIDLIRAYIRRHPGKLRYVVSQPERLNRVTPWMRDFLKRLGIFGNQGHPELLLFPAGGDVILIELKTPTGKWSAEQIGWREWCMARGYRHEVVMNSGKIVAILDAICSA